MKIKNLFVFPGKRAFTFIIASALMLSLAITACKKSNSTPEPGTAKIDMAAINQIGLDHNKGLEQIYQSLKTAKASGQLISANTIVNAIQANIITNLEASKTDPKAISAIKTLLAAQSASGKSLRINMLFNGDEEPVGTLDPGTGTPPPPTTTPTPDPIVAYNSDVASLLTTGERSYLDQLGSIMGNDSQTLQQSLNDVAALESTVQTDLPTDQATLVLIGSSIAKNTMQYWYDNYASWMSLMDPNYTSNSLSINGLKVNKMSLFSWRNFGASDVAGGVGAAVTTWALNAAPGAGQVAYGSAIVAGALGGSATYAVYKLFSND